MLDIIREKIRALIKLILNSENLKHILLKITNKNIIKNKLK